MIRYNLMVAQKYMFHIFFKFGVQTSNFMMQKLPELLIVLAGPQVFAPEIARNFHKSS